jgi:hypothetical protein
MPLPAATMSSMLSTFVIVAGRPVCATAFSTSAWSFLQFAHPGPSTLISITPPCAGSALQHTTATSVFAATAWPPDELRRAPGCAG